MARVSVGDLLQEAVRLHQAQELDAAERIYNSILAHDSTNPDALNLKGMIAFERGRSADALALFERAVAALPSFAAAHINRGNALAVLGRKDDAITALERGLQLQPHDVAANVAMSSLLAGRNEYGRAAAYLRAALEAAAHWTADLRAEMTSNLGDYLRQDKQHDQAIQAQREASALRPHDKTITFNLAVALQDAGRLEEAQHHYLALVKEHPGFARAAVNLATVYRGQRRTDDCITLLEETLVKHPDVFQGYANIGAAFADKGWNITGKLVHAYAMSIKGDDPESRLDAGCSLLGVGQLANWDGYALRFDVVKERNVRRPVPPAVWKGENLARKRVLIWTEQGMGDEILHGSIIPEVIARAGSCVIECSKRMAPIFARSFPCARVVGWSVAHIAETSAGAVDFQIPAGDLGSHFRTSFAQFPKLRSFLKADPEKTAALRHEYQQRAQGRRVVGISWRSQNDIVGGDKSAQLPNLIPILNNPNVMFVNLQYGNCSEELSELRAREIAVFHDPTIDSTRDMDAFFAQVAAMDLVVTTSNTTAHVAGSLGVPVWIMLPHIKGSFWYWFTRRADSPWYPSATLFRAHKAYGNDAWEASVAPRVAEHLVQWVGNPAGRGTP